MTSTSRLFGMAQLPPAGQASQPVILPLRDAIDRRLLQYSTSSGIGANRCVEKTGKVSTPLAAQAGFSLPIGQDATGKSGRVADKEHHIQILYINFCICLARTVCAPEARDKLWPHLLTQPTDVPEAHPTDHL